MAFHPTFGTGSINKSSEIQSAETYSISAAKSKRFLIQIFKKMIFQLFVGLAAACEDLDPWSDERFDAQSRVEVSRENDVLKFSCYWDHMYPSYNGGKVLNEMQDGMKKSHSQIFGFSFE